MSWQKWHIEFEQIHLAFASRGSGQNILLCLQGYGLGKGMFFPFFDTVPAGWRIITMDLPPFGETRWEHKTQILDEPFLLKLWQKLADLFPEAQWHLLGFSMGGKVAMALQLAVERPALSTILLAPDGIRSNFWHRFIRSGMGIALHQWLDSHPQWILAPATLLNRIGLLDRTSHLIVRLSYETPEARQQLSQQLHLYRGLDTSMQRLKNLKPPYPVKWHLIWGRQDKILPARIAKKFLRTVPGSQLHLLEGGHMVFKERLPELRKLIWQLLLPLSTMPVDK